MECMKMQHLKMDRDTQGPAILMNPHVRLGLHSIFSSKMEISGYL
jgi:hypothetical protein